MGRPDAFLQGSLPAAQTLAGEVEEAQGSYAEIFRPPYLKRTVMLVIFQLLQTIGYYGFSSWVPTLLLSQGINITKSLAYTFIIAIASPAAALVATPVRGSVRAQVANLRVGACDRGVWPLFLAVERRCRDRYIRAANRVFEHDLRLFAACLPVGALSDPHSRPGCRLHLFLEPVQHNLRRLFRRLFSQELRHDRGFPVHRQRDGCGDRGDRDDGVTDDEPTARGDLALRAAPPIQYLSRR